MIIAPEYYRIRVSKEIDYEGGGGSKARIFYLGIRNPHWEAPIRVGHRQLSKRQSFPLGIFIGVVMEEEPEVTEYKSQIIEEGILKEGYGIMPIILLRDQRLNDSSKVTYAFLRSYARNKESCFPGQKLLAEKQGVSVPTISQNLQKLKECGYIEIKHKEGVAGRRNKYVIKSHVVFGRTKVELQSDQSPNIRLKGKNNISNMPDLKKSGVKSSLNYFREKYLKEVGKPYPTDWGKDMRIMKKVRETYNARQADDLIDGFFRLCKEDRRVAEWLTVGVFWTQLSRLVIRLTEGK